MKILLLLNMLQMFSMRALDPTYIYIDTSSNFECMESIRVELINDQAQRTLVFKFCRLQAPPDLHFTQCIRGMCYASDSVIASFAPNSADTITLEFYSGATPGSVDGYYLIYDSETQYERDSIHIGGTVEVSDAQRGLLEFSDGILRGEKIERVRIYSVNGALIYDGTFHCATSVVLPIQKKGVYLLKVKENGEDVELKVIKGW
ncbi:MAG TPA: T9SS type A sorting domain-containing protein [Candidatus Hydrothermia bacterium]|nr:T9SS type A sorting domain-containing protein [Candidatus Hydrothermia bacterium]